MEFFEQRKRVADRLRSARKEKGMTQGTLAKLAQTDATFISEIETMKANPSILTLFRLCEVLDIDPAWLVGGETAS